VPAKRPRANVDKSGGNVEKSAAISAGVKKVGGRPFAVGADPRRGNGPAKGAPNAGRPRDEWKARLRAMASKDQVLDHVESALDMGPAHPFFEKALAYVTDHGYGRASQSLDVTTGGEPLTLRVVRE